MHNQCIITNLQDTISHPRLNRNADLGGIEVVISMSNYKQNHGV